MDVHSVILPIVRPRRGSEFYSQILSGCTPDLNKEWFRGGGRITVQHDALIDFNDCSSDIATHDGTFEDFIQCISVLSVVLCDGDGLDFLILILGGDCVLVEGEPDAGITELLTLVCRSNSPVDIHAPESLIWTE